MKKKIFYLSTCSTCARIMKDLGIDSTIEKKDIKTEKITAKELDDMAKASGSYEALFSRRSMKYRPMGLHEKDLTEEDYRSLILEEYTFLKRPVIQIGNSYYIGNSKKTIEAAKEALYG